MQDVVDGDLVSEFGPRNGRYGRILTERKRFSIVCEVTRFPFGNDAAASIAVWKRYYLRVHPIFRSETLPGVLNRLHNR